VFSAVPDRIARGPPGWTRATVLLIPIRLGARATARALRGGLQVLTFSQKGELNTASRARAGGVPYSYLVRYKGKQ
jgi:hypothetical protein